MFKKVFALAVLSFFCVGFFGCQAQIDTEVQNEKLSEFAVPFTKGPTTPPFVNGPDSPPPEKDLDGTPQSFTEFEDTIITIP